jgi:hypothetical protein
MEFLMVIGGVGIPLFLFGLFAMYMARKEGQKEKQG